MNVEETIGTLIAFARWHEELDRYSLLALFWIWLNSGTVVFLVWMISQLHIVCYRLPVPYEISNWLIYGLWLFIPMTLHLFSVLTPNKVSFFWKENSLNKFNIKKYLIFVIFFNNNIAHFLNNASFIVYTSLKFLVF